MIQNPDNSEHAAAVPAEFDAAPVFAGSLAPDPSPLNDAEPSDEWRDEFALICVPEPDQPCPVRCPNGTPSGLPLHLSRSKLALYHELIGWTPPEPDDCPATDADAHTLLFLAAHRPETWNAETALGPPLRRSLDRFRACVDAWVDATLPDFSVESRAAARHAAAALWRYHAGSRPVPDPEKKTTLPAMMTTGNS